MPPVLKLWSLFFAHSTHILSTCACANERSKPPVKKKHIHSPYAHPKMPICVSNSFGNFSSVETAHYYLEVIGNQLHHSQEKRFYFAQPFVATTANSYNINIHTLLGFTPRFASHFDCDCCEPILTTN